MQATNCSNSKSSWYSKLEKVKFESEEEYTVIINGVQFTFYDYPYEIKAEVKFESYINMPDLLTLAAMKAFALGKRAKWKDYIDLYFILQSHSLGDIVKKLKKYLEISLMKNYLDNN
ncbi:MAG: hypothetical protein O2871_04205 [bacterium]|nr:hypothetical protein [bacterium]